MPMVHVLSRLWHMDVLPARQPMQPGGRVRQPNAILDYIPSVRVKEFGLWIKKKGGQYCESAKCILLYLIIFDIHRGERNKQTFNQQS
jgi:hypothetical protein